MKPRKSKVAVSYLLYARRARDLTIRLDDLRSKYSILESLYASTCASLRASVLAKGKLEDRLSRFEDFTRAWSRLTANDTPKDEA